MAAFEHGLFHRRQKSENRESGLPLQHRRQRTCQRFPASVEQDSLEVAFGSKSRQPPDLCRESQHTPLRPDDQDGRAGQNIGKGKGTRLIRTVEAVIIPHGTFQNGDLPAMKGYSGTHGISPLQKQIQVAGRNPQNPGMKHRVDIIRPALESVNVHAPLFQSGKQRTGDNCLPRSAVHGCDHYLLHGLFPEISQIGF